MDYYDAKRKLNGRYSRKVGNNTYLADLGFETIGLRLHNTYVITWFPNGEIRLTTNGWMTVTTKERINSYLPDGLVCHSDKDGWWAIYKIRYRDTLTNEYGYAYPRYSHDGRRFFDGMVINADGKVLNPEARY